MLASTQRPHWTSNNLPEPRSDWVTTPVQTRQQPSSHHKRVCKGLAQVPLQQLAHWYNGAPSPIPLELLLGFAHPLAIFQLVWAPELVLSSLISNPAFRAPNTLLPLFSNGLVSTPHAGCAGVVVVWVAPPPPAGPSPYQVYMICPAIWQSYQRPLPLNHLWWCPKCDDAPHPHTSPADFIEEKGLEDIYDIDSSSRIQ